MYKDKGSEMFATFPYTYKKAFCYTQLPITHVF
jgi:hypothetical protein